MQTPRRAPDPTPSTIHMRLWQLAVVVLSVTAAAPYATIAVGSHLFEDGVYLSMLVPMWLATSIFPFALWGFLGAAFGALERPNAKPSLVFPFGAIVFGVVFVPWMLARAGNTLAAIVHDVVLGRRLRAVAIVYVVLNVAQLFLQPIAWVEPGFFHVVLSVGCTFVQLALVGVATQLVLTAVDEQLAPRRRHIPLAGTGKEAPVAVRTS